MSDIQERIEYYKQKKETQINHPITIIRVLKL